MMRTLIYFVGIFLLQAPFVFGQKSKLEALKSIDSKNDFYTGIEQKIWGFAEVGFQETQSSALLQQTLKDSGFQVEAGVAGMPTAFIATYGSGKPVIGILGEYDALPGVAQEAVPELKPIDGQTACHACGHHLFGTASAAAAIAVKDWLVASKKSGTIKFFGTPAEEGGSGKVYLVRDGFFSGVDAVFHWHPSARNSATYSSSLSNKSGKFRFYGVASHASGSPQRGRSALDAVKEFAQKIQQTFSVKPPLESTGEIAKFGPGDDIGGSTDVSDISWVVPTAGLGTATWVPGTAAHSWQAVAAGGMSIGSKGMMMAAKTLAGSMIDAFSNPKLIEDSWKELNKRRGENFKYEPLIGTRKPALDYRK